jgi:hypothetical protein
VREGKLPPPEILTRVEMIDRTNIDRFTKKVAAAAGSKGSN